LTTSPKNCKSPRGLDGETSTFLAVGLCSGLKAFSNSPNLSSVVGSSCTGKTAENSVPKFPDPSASPNGGKTELSLGGTKLKVGAVCVWGSEHWAAKQSCLGKIYPSSACGVCLGGCVLECLPSSVSHCMCLASHWQLSGQQTGIQLLFWIGWSEKLLGLGQLASIFLLGALWLTTSCPGATIHLLARFFCWQFFLAALPAGACAVRVLHAVPSGSCPWSPPPPPEAVAVSTKECQPGLKVQSWEVLACLHVRPVMDHPGVRGHSTHHTLQTSPQVCCSFSWCGSHHLPTVGSTPSTAQCCSWLLALLRLPYLLPSPPLELGAVLASSVYG